MRVLVACKNGNIAPRDKQRHCLCVECKSEAYARRVEWRKRNPERVAEYSRKWCQANPEKRQAAIDNWRVRNPQKVAEMSSKAGAKWSKANPGKRNAITNKRRAALRQRTVAWADTAAIQAFYDEAVRLTRETGVPHEVDHIFPLMGDTVSGLHVPENLQILTRSANRTKQNKVQL